MRSSGWICAAVLSCGCLYEVDPDFGTADRTVSTGEPATSDATGATTRVTSTGQTSANSDASTESTTQDPTGTTTQDSTTSTTSTISTTTETSATGGSGEHVVFITSTQLPGDFGGIDVADQACAERAAAAAMTGTYRAIVSVDGDRARDRLLIAGPVVTTMGDVVATGAADLWDGTVATLIDVNELGEIDNNQGVWSGTTANGDAAAQNCGNWTDASPTADGVRGLKNDAGGWIGAGPDNCNKTFHLYCIEQ